MSPEEFEQLVSEWLDEPDREDLRGRIEAAVRKEPRLAELLAEWQRCEGLLRSRGSEIAGVDWERMEARISAAVGEQASWNAETGSDEALDRLWRRLPSIEHRVDWDRMADRISAKLDTLSGRRAGETPALPGRRRRWLTIGAAGASLLAAAAAVFLAVLPAREPAAVEDGVVLVRVSGPAVASLTGGLVQVRVTGTPRPPEPERFFAIDPAAQTLSGTTGYY